MSSRSTIEAKVVLLGSQGVGKTSLVVQYVEHEFHEKTSSTVGACFFTKKLTFGKNTAKLQIWDTAGEERFRTMAPMYYRGASAALLVYSVANPKSLEGAKEWLQELRENNDSDPVICLLANQVDMLSEGDNRSIIDHGRAFAQEVNALFFETSAKTNQGIEGCFDEVVKAIIKKVEERGRQETVGKVNLKAQSPTEQSKCCS